jgi:molybdenum cofactor synthesis domain-containing protein
VGLREEGVEQDRGMAPVGELVGDRGTDETGSAGQEDAHHATVGARRPPTRVWGMELPQVTSMGNGPLGGGDDLLGRALVVIVDDRVSTGEVTDNTGPLVTELLGEAGLVVDGTIVVPGESVAIRNALNTAVIGGVDLVVTVGGTGVSPRAVTADATAGVLDRPIPGIAEAIRASGLAAGAVDAGLSRGLVGVSGSTLVVNLASSRAAVRDGMATLTPLISHVVAELSGMEEH